MAGGRIEKPVYILLAVFGAIAPLVFPAYVQQIAMLWIMIVFALTWDTMGGQMGYNSLGNIFFFGAGMYIAAVCQIWPWYDVGQYTDPSGILTTSFTPDQYFLGLGLGVVLAALGSVVLAVLFGLIVFGLRGPYFAIGTLGMAIAAGEMIGAWDWVGGGGGIRLPVFPSRHRCRSVVPRAVRGIPVRRPSGRLLLLGLLHPGGADLPVPALALPHPLRPDAERDPGRRDQGRGPRRPHPALQDGRLVDFRLFPRHFGGAVRQHHRLYRTARSCLPDRHLRHLHGADGAAGAARARCGGR